MRLIALLIVPLFSFPIFAADMKVFRDLPYAAPKNERQMLDVYAPAEGKNHPIVFWIHGGGWKSGDKKTLGNRPQIIVDKGCVFVATNYRFVPNVTVKEMAGDIAKGIRFVHDHAAEYGGDPNSIIVMGHSSGAHIAALVCTDDGYLKAEGLPLSILKGCVPIDSSFYDIPKRVKDGGDTSPATVKEIFGDQDAFHREVSPATYVAKGKHIPPFLLLHVAERADTKAQANWLAGKLHDAEVSAAVVPAAGKTHGSINSELGVVDDEPTRAFFSFLERVKQAAMK